MKKVYTIIAALIFTNCVFAETDSTSSVIATITNYNHNPLTNATIILLNAKDSQVVKIQVSDSAGTANFSNIASGNYLIKASHVGYDNFISAKAFYVSANETYQLPVIMDTVLNSLQDVTVQSVKQFVQFEKGKVVINVDASPTNIGTSVLDVLEKSPGVTVDKNGGISLKAKAGVLVLIDGRQTYLSGLDLNNLLSSMSSAQVDQIELITNPPARYDASGNAGIINIKTKKNKQKGFNGTINTSYGQGRYLKNNNSIVMNFRNAKFNAFLNYSFIQNKSYSDLYALRTYTNDAGSVTSKLDQPSLFNGKVYNHTLKTGLDFFASTKTTIGIALTGMFTKRDGNSYATATWLNPNGGIDSSLATNSTTNFRLKNGAVNLNMKHSFSNKQDISIDIDWLHYDINNNLYFENSAAGNIIDASNGNIPSALKILTGKIDYTHQLNKNGKFEAGWKSSHINTDNLAAYDYYNGDNWQPDYGKSNHFLYTENIHAAYASIEQQVNDFTMQLGLRYENTAYDANQLGNVLRKDSAFSRSYDGLFPSGYITWQADSSNSFTFTAGRRIDRPAFQSLNPFIFIINRYTYETGNPYFKPQFTWNFELTHQYKNFLTSTLSYSIIKDYFSQLFLTDSNEILYYSQGNVGRAYIAGLSFSTQVSPFKWWTLTGETVFNYKKLNGYVWNDFNSSVWQFNISTNNLFKLNDNYTAELSGFYTGRSRNDLQEALLPTGQLNVGIARTLLKNKATLKLSARDIFHTQVMEGNTDFEHADEYFIIHRDSRVITIAFTYRFGKLFKIIKRSSGAEDEIERVNG